MSGAAEHRAQAGGTAAGGASLRERAPGDLAAIAAIFNGAVERLESTREFEPQPESAVGAWLDAGDPRYFGLVAEADGEVAGWSALTRLYPRPAYDSTAELSVFVAPEQRRRGIGAALAAATIERAVTLDFHCLVLFLFPEPAWLLERAEREGFTPRGELPQAGEWGGELRAVRMLDRLLPAGPVQP